MSTPYCKICHNANLPVSMYTSHYVCEANDKTKITCPTLLTFTCNYCHRTGHTTKFCPSIKTYQKPNPNTKPKPKPKPNPKSKEPIKKGFGFGYSLLDEDEDDTENANKPLKTNTRWALDSYNKKLTSRPAGKSWLECSDTESESESEDEDENLFM